LQRLCHGVWWLRQAFFAARSRAGHLLAVRSWWCCWRPWPELHTLALALVPVVALAPVVLALAVLLAPTA